MDSDQEIFPYSNWVIASLVAVSITLGLFSVFNSDLPAATGSPQDAALIGETERADVLKADIAKPWWHMMLERMLTVERI